MHATKSRGEWPSGLHRFRQVTAVKDPLLTMTLCAPNENQDKGNLSHGATKNHG